jgi:cytochrome c556
MLHLNNLRLIFATLIFALVSVAFAEGDDPRHERHELMEGVKKAAGPIGKMLKGERDYDADVVMASLETWHEASLKFGDLFTERFMDIEVSIPLNDALDLCWQTMAECFEPEELLMREHLIEKYFPKKKETVAS